MKRVFAMLLSAAMLLSLLAGCAPDLDAYVPTGDGLTWDEGYTGPAQTHPHEETQELTLTYYPNRSMNPLVSADYTNRVLFSLLYQGLFAVDSKSQPHPILCKEYHVSEDMQTYHIYLESASFSDGRQLTATDVVASYQAARESSYYGGRFTHIREITATRRDCVTFYLDTPMEDLPCLLDIPILKASQVAAEQPLGSGPYWLDNSGKHAMLRRRENWWCKATVAATATAIGLLEATNPTQIRDNFEMFDLDIVCTDPGSDHYADYRCDFELWDCETGIFLYLLCNMNSLVFSEPQVRAALTYAIDRDSIAKSEYQGFGQSATLPASPTWAHYNQALADRYKYDGTGDTLKNAIENAGLSGASVTLLVNSDDSKRTRVAQTVAQALTDAGLVVTVNACEYEDFRSVLRNRNFDLCLAQTKLSPNMDLGEFFSADGSLSYGSIYNDHLYDLCNEALANHGNYYTLHQTVMNDGRICPILFYSYAVYATRGLITGLAPARDNVFFYSLGKDMADIKLEEVKPTAPPETTAPETTAPPETTE